MICTGFSVKKNGKAINKPTIAIGISFLHFFIFLILFSYLKHLINKRRFCVVKKLLTLIMLFICACAFGGCKQIEVDEYKYKL